MSVVSLRFRNDETHRKLRGAADASGVSMSALAERLIEEGLRMEAHPAIHFRSGRAGRRPALVGSQEIIDVIIAVVGSNTADREVRPSERRTAIAEDLSIPEWQLDAALAYYAEFTEEIDAAIRERIEASDAAEAVWRRQQAILAG